MPRHGATLNDLTRMGKVLSDKRRATCMKNARKAREKGLRRTYGALRAELINLMGLASYEAACVIGEDSRVFAVRQSSPEIVSSDLLLRSIHVLLQHRAIRARFYEAKANKILADIANRRMP